MSRRSTPHVIAVLLMVAVSGCERHPSREVKKSEPPARIDAPVKEADLTTVHLTPEAETRLGITVSPVERKSIPLTRMFGGTVTVRQGGSIRIAAPLAGTLLTADADLPRPGQAVRRQQPLLKLAPVFASTQEVLSPSDRLSLARARSDLAASRAEAEGQLHTTEAQLQAARIQLDRADRLRRDKAGSEQAYEEALAAVRKAEAQLEAAQARLEVLRSTRLEMRPESAPALEINAPLDGVIDALHVRGGLEVPSGAPLVDVIATDPIWLRVPVYSGELDAVDPSRGAVVRLLGTAEGASETAARPVDAAPAGNPNAASIDLFFEIPNPGMRWKPEQKVIVRVPLRQPAETLLVPGSAVVHDIHGGSWVYVKTESHAYTRRRVEVREIIDGLAALSRGPQPGTPVVTAGAAELFGTEFGVGK